MEEKPYKGFVIWHLLWSNLGVRPLRSALSVCALALQVFLILLIVGLTSGALTDWRTRAEGIGADIIVQPPNSSIFFAFSSAVMPESLADKMASLPDIDEVGTVLIVVDQKNLGVVYGIDYDRFAGLSNGFTYISGGPFQRADQAIADDLAATDPELAAARASGRTILRRGQRQRGSLFYSHQDGPGHCRRRRARLDVFRSQQGRYRGCAQGACQTVSHLQDSFHGRVQHFDDFI
jgi:hypothetical protein